MKDTFKVRVVNTKTQSSTTINSTAETLGELKSELSNAGIDYDGMTFLEGSTKTELKDDSSILPTQVPVKVNGAVTGELTNNLVFFLTATAKKIESGAMDRKAAYAAFKANQSLADAFKKSTGKNYTNAATDTLVAFIEKHSVKAPKAAACCNDDFKANVEKYVESLREAGEISDRVYNNLLIVLNGGSVEPEEKFTYSDDDIDRMYGDWMK